MADSRNANKPNKPDKNEVWSWVVIALLFAFAWPVGLIVLLAKLSDGKRKQKLSAKEKAALIANLEKEMKEASRRLEFEYAAVLRDQIIELRGKETAD